MRDNDYKDCYGLWEVRTETDCEGRSTRILGIFEGYLDEIAFALSEKCIYKLMFKKISAAIPKPSKIRQRVDVCLDIDSSTWEMSAEERVDFFSHMLANRDVQVNQSGQYAAVTLCRKSEEEIERQIALAKLSDREKKLLGLKE